MTAPAYERMRQSLEASASKISNCEKTLRDFAHALRIDVIAASGAPAEVCNVGTITGPDGVAVDRFISNGSLLVFGIELRFPVQSVYVPFPVVVAVDASDAGLLVRVKGGEAFHVRYQTEFHRDDVRAVAVQVLTALARNVMDYVS